MNVKMNDQVSSSPHVGVLIDCPGQTWNGVAIQLRPCLKSSTFPGQTVRDIAWLALCWETIEKSQMKYHFRPVILGMYAVSLLKCQMKKEIVLALHKDGIMFELKELSLQ